MPLQWREAGPKEFWGLITSGWSDSWAAVGRLYKVRMKGTYVAPPNEVHNNNIKIKSDVSKFTNFIYLGIHTKKISCPTATSTKAWDANLYQNLL